MTRGTLTTSGYALLGALFFLTAGDASATLGSVIEGQAGEDVCVDPVGASLDSCDETALAGDITLHVHFVSLPGLAEMEILEEQMRRANMILCDATDGALRVRNVHWTIGDESVDDADMVIYPQEGRSFVTERGLGVGRTNMFGSDVRGDVLAHELGHLVLGLGDLYAEDEHSVAFDGGDHGTGLAISKVGVNLAHVQEAGATIGHSIMQQSGSQVCVEPSSGLSEFQDDPEFTFRGENTCYDNSDCSGTYSDCADLPPLMSELSSPGSGYDALTGHDASCPTQKETREIVFRGNVDLRPSPSCGIDFDGDGDDFEPHLGEACDGSGNIDCPDGSTAGCSTALCRGWYSRCATPPTCGDNNTDNEEHCDGTDIDVTCEDFGFQGGGAIACQANCTADLSGCIQFDNRMPTSGSGGGIRGAKDRYSRNELKVRDASNSNANAWHTIYWEWLGQNDTTGTLFLSVPEDEYGGGDDDIIVAVWDIEFDSATNLIATINGQAYDPASPPQIVLGGNDVATFMTDATSSSGRQAVQPTGGFDNGASALTLSMDLSELYGEDFSFDTTWSPRAQGIFGYIPAGTDPALDGQVIPAHDRYSDSAFCRLSYNETTQRFEASRDAEQQMDKAIRDGDSVDEAISGISNEWTRVATFLDEQYSVTLQDSAPLDPGEMPSQNPPASCGAQAINFFPNLAGATADLLPARVVLALDRSGSMETEMGGFNSGTRLDFVKAGARTLFEMQATRCNTPVICPSGIPTTPDVGLVWFNHEVDTRVGDPLLTLVNGTPGSNQISDHDIAYDHLRDSNHEDGEVPGPDGFTDISAALRRAEELIVPVPSAVGRTIVLLSDGEDTVEGNDFVEETKRLIQESGDVKIHTMPTAMDDGSGSADYAADYTGGRTFPTPDPADLPVSFFEVGARQQGQPLAFHFSQPNVEVSTGSGEQNGPAQLLHRIQVESGARSLSAVIAATGGNVSNKTIPSSSPPDANGGISLDLSIVPWNPTFTLRSPSGQYVTPAIYKDTHFQLVQIPYPQAGEWILTFNEGTPAQMAGYVDNPEVGCSVDLDTSAVASGGGLRITGSARDGATLGEGVNYSARLVRPDDSVVRYDLDYDRFTRSYSANVPRSDLNGRGMYRVVGECDVSDDVEVNPGETFGLDEQDLTDQATRPARAFYREPSDTSFVDLDFAPPVPTTGRRAGDCDLDGIPNERELPGDFDGDGLDDICDGDADGDDTPDGVDPNTHDPNVPQPKICTAFPVNVGCCDAIWSCTGAKDYPLYAEGNLDVRDSARIFAADGAPGQLANAGTGTTTVGAQATTGTVLSDAQVELKSHATVDGDLLTEVDVVKQDNTTVTGEEDVNASLILPPLSDFDIEFPPAVTDIHLEPEQTGGLAPGSYGKVSLKSRSVLHLQSGVYYFDELNVAEPDSKIVLVTTSQRPTYIYVKSSYYFRGAFEDDAGRQDLLFVGYFGQEPAHVEAPFVGTFVAPNAQVYLKPLNGDSHHGSFFGKNIEVDAGVKVHHVPFTKSWLGNGASMVLPPADNPDDGTGGEFSGPELLGFEDTTRLWTGTMPLGTSTSATEGSSSLELSSCGYQEISSPTMQNSELSGVGDQMSLDVFVPGSVDNPWWVGTLQLQLVINGQVHSLNTESLTELARGEWTTLNFPLSSTIRSALLQEGTVQAKLIANTSVCSTSLLIDNLRMTGTITLGVKEEQGSSSNQGCTIASGPGTANGPWRGMLLSLLAGAGLLVGRRRRRES